jgi:hypothetical protein
MVAGHAEASARGQVIGIAGSVHWRRHVRSGLGEAGYKWGERGTLGVRRRAAALQSHSRAVWNRDGAVASAVFLEAAREMNRVPEMREMMAGDECHRVFLENFQSRRRRHRNISQPISNYSILPGFCNGCRHIPVVLPHRRLPIGSGVLLRMFGLRSWSFLRVSDFEIRVSRALRARALSLDLQPLTDQGEDVADDEIN